MSIRRGLPYGWWKSPDFWAATISLLCLSGLASVLFLAWFLDWKAWW